MNPPRCNALVRHGAGLVVEIQFTPETTANKQLPFLEKLIKALMEKQRKKIFILEFKVMDRQTATATTHDCLDLVQTKLQAMAILQVQEFASLTAEFESIDAYEDMRTETVGEEFCDFLVRLRERMLRNGGALPPQTPMTQPSLSSTGRGGFNTGTNTHGGSNFGTQTSGGSNATSIGRGGGNAGRGGPSTNKNGRGGSNLGIVGRGGFSAGGLGSGSGAPSGTSQTSRGGGRGRRGLPKDGNRRRCGHLNGFTVKLVSLSRVTT